MKSKRPWRRKTPRRDLFLQLKNNIFSYDCNTGRGFSYWFEHLSEYKRYVFEFWTKRHRLKESKKSLFLPAEVTSFQRLTRTALISCLQVEKRKGGQCKVSLLTFKSLPIVLFRITVERTQRH